MRFGVRGLVPVFAVIVVMAVGSQILIGLLPVTVLMKGTVPAVGVFGLLVCGLILRFGFGFKRLVRGLAANPGGCLNCGYATTDPRTGVCPECAHHTDRTRLNRSWRENLDRQARRPGAGW